MLLGALLALVVAAPARAELTWRPLDGPPRPEANSSFGFAYDSTRDRFVMFGGYRAETWTVSDGVWTRHDGAGPPNGSLMAMTYDAARDEVVMFGGGYGAGEPNAETWTWDGHTWEQRTTPAGMPARRTGAMVYDPVRQEVVLFGGLGGDSRSYDTSFPLGDTWIWDGEAWEERTPAASPAPRLGHAMTWDASRQEIVLFGGDTTVTDMNDTWTWDGTTWTEQTPADAPPGRAIHNLAYDGANGTVVMFGGADIGGFFGDTWVWDGENWIEKHPARVPDRRGLFGFGYDAKAGEPRLFHGFAAYGALRDSWAWTGSDWVERTVPPGPGMVLSPSMAFHEGAGEAVLFGGDGSHGLRDETWTFDGAEWTRRDVVTRPPARSMAVMAYDGGRDEVLLFGGFARGPLGDTWSWNGADWRQETADGPQARDGAAMAYDPVRDRVVLFGGQIEEITTLPVVGEVDRQTPAVDDTWLWDGSAWTEVEPATSPPARTRASLAWDAESEELILFGGRDDEGVKLTDTWAWTGTDWEERPAIEQPPGGLGRPLVTDPATGQVVQYTATPAGQPETWVWSQTTWTRLSMPAQPPGRTSFVAAGDTRRGGVLLFGGANPFTADTWRLAPETGAPALAATTPLDGAALGSPWELSFGLTESIVRSRTRIEMTHEAGDAVKGSTAFRDGERTVAFRPDGPPLNGRHVAVLNTVTADGEPFEARMTFVVEGGRVEAVDTVVEVAGTVAGRAAPITPAKPPGRRSLKVRRLRGRRVAVTVRGPAGTVAHVAMLRRARVGGYRRAAQRTLRLRDGRARVVLRLRRPGRYRVTAVIGFERFRSRVLAFR